MLLISGKVANYYEINWIFEFVFYFNFFPLPIINVNKYYSFNKF